MQSRLKPYSCVSTPVDLFAQIKEGQQEQPQRIHEMPVVRSDFRRNGARHLRLIEIPLRYVDEGGDASKQMQRVRTGENVKEAAGGGAGKIDSFGNQLPPGHDFFPGESYSHSPVG